jgi:ribosomal protein L40E
VTEERRCPNCGALVSEDAEWCGQCFTDLRAPDPKPAPEPTPAIATQPRSSVTGVAQRAPAFWPCTVCGAENPIALDVCATCGTPFAAVMRGTARRDVDPRSARSRSMLFPGAGHTALGYPMDGFARGAVFTLALAVAIFLAVTVPHSGLLLFAIGVLLAAAVGVYVLSLAETNQLSAGGGLIMPSRMLLWAAVGLMFLIVAVIALSIAGNARR